MSFFGEREMKVVVRRGSAVVVNLSREFGVEVAVNGNEDRVMRAMIANIIKRHRAVDCMKLPPTGTSIIFDDNGCPRSSLESVFGREKAESLSIAFQHLAQEVFI